MEGDLGSAFVLNNHAEFKFKFVYASTKKLKFVGFSPDNNTLSEVQGEITIAGKNQISKETKYEYTNASLPNNTTDKSYNSNSGSITAALSGASVVYPNPNVPTFSDTFDENNKVVTNVYPFEQPTNEVAWTFFSSIQNEVIPLAHKYRVPASVIMAMAAIRERLWI
jgi:flagellum-specific peptidoglycan hydrolase FlgJ